MISIRQNMDAFRRPERFERFLLACEADLRGRWGLSDEAYPQSENLRRALSIANEIDAGQILADGIAGEAVGRELHRRRVAAVTERVPGTA